MARFEVPDGWTAQAYRFALDPNPSQVTLLESHCGAARLAFNHRLWLFPSTQLCSRCAAKTKLRLRDRTYRCRNGCPPIDRDLNAAINLARLGDPSHGETGTGTGSRSAASVPAGGGRGAIQKTSPTTAPAAVGTAGGDETSTPHTASAGAGTAAPQGEAA